MESNIEDIEKYVKELYEEKTKGTIKLSAWQDGFIDDMNAKIKAYGASPKQRAKIVEIYEQKLGDGGEEETKDMVDHYNRYNRR